MAPTIMMVPIILPTPLRSNRPPMHSPTPREARNIQLHWFGVQFWTRSAWPRAARRFHTSSLIARGRDHALSITAKHGRENRIGVANAAPPRRGRLIEPARRAPCQVQQSPSAGPRLPVGQRTFFGSSPRKYCVSSACVAALASNNCARSPYNACNCVVISFHTSSPGRKDLNQRRGRPS